MRYLKFVSLLLFILFLSPSLFAEQSITGVWGASFDKGLKFKDSEGKLNTLEGHMAGLPTVFTFVFYNCPNVCGIVNLRVAELVKQIELKPDVDYKVVTLSFDHRESSELASKKRESFLKSFKSKFDWKFMTGDQENIKKLGLSLGFPFSLDIDREKNEHPLGLYVLNPNGTIHIIVKGTDFPKSEIEAALKQLRPKTGRLRPIYAVYFILILLLSYGLFFGIFKLQDFKPTPISRQKANSSQTEVHRN